MAGPVKPVGLALFIALLAVTACTEDDDSNSPYPAGPAFPSSSYDRPYDFRYGSQLRYGDDYCNYHRCRSSYWP